MPDIHPTAIVDPKASIADGVTIGAYSMIGPHVSLGKNVTVHPHVVIEGHTTIGEGTTIFPFTSLGTIPQDMKYHGEKTTLEIGAQNTIREHVTMNPGTEGGGGKTVIGDHGLFMVGVHIGHDCRVGNHVILANNATLAGHVTLEDYVRIGGLSAVHQFVRIGKHAMIGGMSGIENDVIPYSMAMGERAHLSGLNLIGLKRRNFDREAIHDLRAAYRMLFSPEGTLEERIEDVADMFKDHELISEIIAFMQSDNTRSLTQPRLEK